MGQWHAADEYDGQVREITLRSCWNSPMCPSDTTMTEYQHYVLSTDKKKLVFDTVQQAHHVSFGSYFEVHCGWCHEIFKFLHLELIFPLSIFFPGVHFKKWCIMQFKIKAGTIDEYKKEVAVMLEVACSFIKSKYSSGETDTAISSPSTQKNKLTTGNVNVCCSSCGRR